jgi:endonuclease/exonuclease/phosphatase family metal-dependent hydrolase
MKYRHLRLGLALLLGFGLAVAAWPGTEFLDRPGPASFRLMSYNPYWDAIFPTGPTRYNRALEFERILKAVQPDIVCIQEVDQYRDRAEVIAIFERALPLPAGDQWSVVSGADNVIVSRFPLPWTVGEIVNGRGVRARGHVLALVDLPDDVFGSDVLIAGTHFTSGGSGSEIRARTEHADTLVAALRAAGRQIPAMIPVPVIVAGDLNAYGTDPRRHVDTITLGDISDERSRGADGSLEPSGAPMIDLLPAHNGTGPETWTWRDDTQEFEPYPLDRIIYTGSLLAAEHSFVLNTAIMTPDDLAGRGLEAGDVALDMDAGNFDHLPLVVDFRIR